MQLTRSQLASGIRPDRKLTAREARWIAELDTTPYVVIHAARPERGWAESRYRVTGYTSARAVAKSANSRRDGQTRPYSVLQDGGMMSTPEQIRVLRYHMTSGHVLQETVDSELNDVSDSELLQRISLVFLERRYITITEGTTDSGVLVSTDRIEFVQVAHAELLISRADAEAAMQSEESAIAVARKLWGLGDDDTA